MNGSKPIAETEKEIVEEFALFDSWDDKYEYIIDLGKKLPGLKINTKKKKIRSKGASLPFGLLRLIKTGK